MQIGKFHSEVLTEALVRGIEGELCLTSRRQI
jgi:hypothetical protein